MNLVAPFDAMAQTTVNLPKGTVGSPYNQATSIATSHTVNLSSGKLPPGLSINSGKDFYSLQGIPTEAGNFTFTVKAMPSGISVTFNITIDPAPTPPAITTTALYGGIVGSAFNRTLEASGTTPITWSISEGALHPGLSLSPAGVIWLRAE